MEQKVEVTEGPVDGSIPVGGPVPVTRITLWEPGGAILEVVDNTVGHVASVGLDRTVTFGVGYRPDATAKKFWDALARHAIAHEADRGPDRLRIDTRLGPVLSVPGVNGWMAVLNLDRTLETGPDYEPDRAALMFWSRLAEAVRS